MHCQTIQMVKWETNSNSPSSMFTPKPDACLCMSVDLPLGKKTVENPGLGRGPPGLGLRAGGPLAGRGLRAAGLLFAKPFKHSSSLT